MLANWNNVQTMLHSYRSEVTKKKWFLGQKNSTWKTIAARIPYSTVPYRCVCLMKGQMDLVVVVVFYYYCFAYRTSAVAHSYIALNVQCWWAGETESFHVCVHLRFKIAAVRPRTCWDHQTIANDYFFVLWNNQNFDAIATISIIFYLGSVKSIYHRRDNYIHTHNCRCMSTTQIIRIVTKRVKKKKKKEEKNVA